MSAEDWCTSHEYECRGRFGQAGAAAGTHRLARDGCCPVAAGMSGSQPDAAIWYYADADSKQKGPITAAAFRQLWDEADVDGMTLVWTPGMPSWQPVSETPALRAKLVGGDDDDNDADAEAAAGNSSAAVHSSSAAVAAHADPSASASSGSAAPTAAGVAPGGYLYADVTSGKQLGPLAPDALRAMVEAGYVAATTLVWRPGMLGWQPLSEVAELQPAGVAAAGSSADGGVGIKRSRAEMEAAAAQGQPNSAAQHHGSAAAAEEGSAEGGTAGSHPHPRGKQPQGVGGAPKRRRGLGAQQARENPWVYVTGLPADATEAELASHFKKAGVLALDLLTGAPKVRVYRVPEAGMGAGAGGAAADGADPAVSSARTGAGASTGAGAGAGGSGRSAASPQPGSAPDSSPARPAGACKGDASICFVKEASVDLAVTLLDDVELRPGVRLRVEPASFARGDGAGGGAGGAGGGAGGGGGKAKKAKRHAGQTASAAASAHLAGLSAKEQAVVRAREAEQRAALSWAEEGDESLGLRVLVLRHMFAPDELAADAAFAEELEEDVASEALRFGEVERLSIFSRHPDGVIMVKYASAGAAADALAAFSGRFFGGRRIAAGYWDGVTDFKAEAEEHDASDAGAGAAAHAQPSRPHGGSAGGAAGDGGGADGSAGTSAGDNDEDVRLDAFGAWLESETGGGAADAASAGSTGATTNKQPTCPYSPQ